MIRICPPSPRSALVGEFAITRGLPALLVFRKVTPLLPEAWEESVIDDEVDSCRRGSLAIGMR